MAVNLKEGKMHKLTLPTMKSKLTGDSNHWLLISLNVNELNSPIKRQRLTDWIQIQNPSLFCMQKTQLNLKDGHCFRVKGWEEVFQSNELMKEVGIAILVPKKMDFKLKSITRDKGGHFTLVTGKIHQEKSHY